MIVVRVSGKFSHWRALLVLCWRLCRAQGGWTAYTTLDMLPVLGKLRRPLAPAETMWD